MIIFVGDEPGTKNLSKGVAFVGTKSYKKLLSWIVKLDITINDVHMCNKEDLKEYRWGGEFYISEYGRYELDILPSEDIIIALGNKAEKAVLKTGLNYFKLPHPSGSNRLFNKPGYEKEVINDCRQWLEIRGYYERYR